MALLEVSKVDFQYYGSSFGLQDVNLTLNKGERLALYGCENAGKTTLLRVLCGLEEYYRGSILLDGVELKELSQKDMDIGFSFDRRILDGKDIASDVISYPMKLRNMPSDYVESYLKQVSEKCKIPLTSQIKDMSDAQVVMLILARLFAVDRRIYLIDDVWKDLPEDDKFEVYGVIAENLKGKSAIISTDDSDFAMKISTGSVLVLTERQVLPMLTVEEILKRPLNMQSAVFAGYELHIGQLVKTEEEYFADICGKLYPVSRPMGEIYVGKRVCFAVKRLGERCDTEDVGNGEVMNFYYDVDNERIISMR